MEISESLINGESGNYLRIREIGRKTSFPLTIKGVKSKLNVKIAKNSLKRTILAWCFAIDTEKMAHFSKYGSIKRAGLKIVLKKSWHTLFLSQLSQVIAVYTGRHFG